MIIAVDFDGTLCVDAYPGIGEANMQLIRLLACRQAAGDKLILWTCRCGRQLLEAVNWCRMHGLTFDAVNDNLPEVIAKWGNDSRKVSADVYIDDRSVQPWINSLQLAG